MDRRPIIRIANLFFLFPSSSFVFHTLIFTVKFAIKSIKKLCICANSPTLAIELNLHSKRRYLKIQHTILTSAIG